MRTDRGLVVVAALLVAVGCGRDAAPPKTSPALEVPPASEPAASARDVPPPRSDPDLPPDLPGGCLGVVPELARMVAAGLPPGASARCATDQRAASLRWNTSEPREDLEAFAERHRGQLLLPPDESGIRVWRIGNALYFVRPCFECRLQLTTYELAAPWHLPVQEREDLQRMLRLGPPPELTTQEEWLRMVDAAARAGP